MSTKHKSYDAKLKAKIALAVLTNEHSLTEICTKYQVPKTSVYEWKEKLINEAESLFIPLYEKGKKEKLLNQEIVQLHQLIGEMSVENKFLKKKLMK